MNENEIIINGADFNNFNEFIDYMNEVAFTEFKWHGNLDAFNDLLCGGFENLVEGKNIHWINSDLSKIKLGYKETIKWHKKILTTCHPSNRKDIRKDLRQARNNIGITLYDMIIEIMNDNANGEWDDNIKKVVIE